MPGGFFTGVLKIPPGFMKIFRRIKLIPVAWLNIKSEYISSPITFSG